MENNREKGMFDGMANGWEGKGRGAWRASFAVYRSATARSVWCALLECKPVCNVFLAQRCSFRVPGLQCAAVPGCPSIVRKIFSSSNYLSV